MGVERRPALFSSDSFNRGGPVELVLLLMSEGRLKPKTKYGLIRVPA